MLFVICRGQDFCLGLNGGASYNSFTKQKNINFTDAQGGINVFAGLKIFLEFKHLQIGAGGAVATMSREYKSAVPYFYYDKEYYLTYNSRIPMYPVNVFVNYKLQFPKSYIYFGVNGGHIFFGKNENNSVQYSTDLIPAYGNLTVGMEAPESTLFGGIQGGYNVSVSQHFSLCTEIGVNYIPVKLYYNSHNYALQNTRYLETFHFYYVPLSVGINYVFR